MNNKPSTQQNDQNTSTSSFNNNQGFHPENFSLRNIIKLMPGNIFWKDKEGRYLGANNNVAKLLGLNSPEEIIGKYNHDIILDAEVSSYLDQFDRECLESGQEMHFEESGLDIHNHPATYFTQKLPLKNDSGEIIGLVGISFDITERKKIEHELQVAKEAAEASNLAKSQFLALINHELRTPLTGILGFIDILKKPLNSSEKDQAINSLDNCAQYLLTLVNDVLNFTKLDANKTEIQMHPVSFTQLTSEVCSILDSLVKNKGLELRCQIQKDLPLLLTDSHAFKQILINIINNAIKFTNVGSINITIDYTQPTAHKIALEIRIADTGQGIPVDKLDFIFEPFKQLENTYIRQSSRSGTGLGLAIVKRLLQLLNCNIRVESEINKGSTFIINGEFDISHDNANTYYPQLAPEALTNDQSPLQTTKALLVEDDTIVQMVHQRMLTDLHCEVNVASCGKEALSFSGLYDIAFIDIGLSDMTGFELIRRLRQSQQTIQHTYPIIALTGYTGEKERIACIEAGANEVIAKPVSFEKLKELLQKYK